MALLTSQVEVAEAEVVQEELSQLVIKLQEKMTKYTKYKIHEKMTKYTNKHETKAVKNLFLKTTDDNMTYDNMVFEVHFQPLAFEVHDNINMR